jgi:hypothetical protein
MAAISRALCRLAGNLNAIPAEFCLVVLRGFKLALCYPELFRDTAAAAAGPRRSARLRGDRGGE